MFAYEWKIQFSIECIAFKLNPQHSGFGSIFYESVQITFESMAGIYSNRHHEILFDSQDTLHWWTTFLLMKIEHMNRVESDGHYIMDFRFIL